MARHWQGLRTLHVMVRVWNRLRVPAVRSIARQHILREGQFCSAINRLSQARQSKRYLIFQNEPHPDRQD